MMCVYAFQEIRDMTQPWPRIKVRRAIQLSLRALRVPGCSVCVWFQSDAPGEDYLPPPTIKISGRFLRCKKDSKSGTRVGQCVCMYRVTAVHLLTPNLRTQTCARYSKTSAPQVGEQRPAQTWRRPHLPRAASAAAVVRRCTMPSARWVTQARKPASSR